METVKSSSSSEKVSLRNWNFNIVSWGCWIARHFQKKLKFFERLKKIKKKLKNRLFSWKIKKLWTIWKNVFRASRNEIYGLFWGHYPPVKEIEKKFQKNIKKLVSQCRKLRFHEFYEIKHETLAYSYICGLNTYPPSMLNAKHAKFQVKSGRRRGRLFDLVIRDYLKKKEKKTKVDTIVASYYVSVY